MDRNEAIKIVKSHYPANKQMLNEALEFLIPELAESEDERIRKALIRFHKSTIDIDGIKGADVITWLEKQKPITNKEDEEVRQYLIRTMKRCDINVPMVQKALAWLEKQGEKKSQRMISAEAKEAMYDKPALNEKDEQHIDSLLKRLDGLCRNEFERTRFAISEDRDWLTSLKERIE